jgi:hypothetical protein
MVAGEAAAATPADNPARVDATASDLPAWPASGRCWCTYLPAAVALPSEPGGACWCPSCLAAHIGAAAQMRNGAK